MFAVPRERIARIHASSRTTGQPIVVGYTAEDYPGGAVAVDDLSLEVPDGKIMILVGPSGCGKTTTLRMVNRLVEPTGGRILLDGRDVAQARPAALRRASAT
jgi:osmoprotectant transport system ATP-binding protein